MFAVLVLAPRPGDATAISPAVRVAGLPLALRGALTLQQQGADRIMLAGGEAERDWLERLRADPRLRCALEWHEADAPFDSEAPFVVTRYDTLVDPAVLRELGRAQLGDRAALAAAVGGRPIGPLLTRALPQDAEAELLDVGQRWFADARSHSGRQLANFQLFEACRKSVDGIVSRYLNRNISLFISRRLCDTPITPNAMTLVTFAISLAGCGFAARGGYGATLLGALLMQVGSILDGVDGELARVRFEGSKLGQWLDTVADDASNVAFWAALGFGARTIPVLGPWLALAGWVAAAANGLAAAQYYWVLRRIGSGDLYALQAGDAAPRPGLRGKVVVFFQHVLKQDFFLLLVLCLALAGVLPYALPVVAIGALITFGSATARTLRRTSAPGE